MSDAGAALAEVVGPGHVLAGDRAAAFAVGGRVPRWVAFPETAAEVARCLAVAAERGLSVAPTGRGNRLHWGNPPRALELVLSLRRLDRILAHEAADLTISVEAGVTLAAIAERLRAFRQLLPLDPPRAAGSTVGGIVATAASGPYRARYGTIRDLLLGVTVARSDGTVVKGGGRVVKNATGYDTPKLHVGALGTLGVVVAAHLRLHPRPAVEATWLFQFGSAESVLEAALGVMDAAVVVSRLQLLDSPALAVTVGSVAEGVRAQGALIAEICGRAGGVESPLGDAEAWWAGVREVAWPPTPDCLALRVGVRPTDVVKAWRAVEAAARDACACRATAEVANGLLHLVLTGPGLVEAPRLLGTVREGLAPLGGSAVVEHAPAAVAPALEAWGDAGPALDVMRRLKAEMDPAGILNPGRYVGGI
ncbi:MAG: FAD-binding oxidoreductase [Candidatus Rokubacteria bacterium]|nr:FAD-binding oxidoreductase [Candidatus Rokubacteria bacterium]